MALLQSCLKASVMIINISQSVLYTSNLQDLPEILCSRQILHQLIIIIITI